MPEYSFHVVASCCCVCVVCLGSRRRVTTERQLVVLPFLFFSAVAHRTDPKGAWMSSWACNRWCCHCCCWCCCFVTTNLNRWRRKAVYLAILDGLGIKRKAADSEAAAPVAKQLGSPLLLANLVNRMRRGSQVEDGREWLGSPAPHWPTKRIVSL